MKLIAEFSILIPSLMQMIPVAANDVAFSMHAVLLTSIILFQIAIYDVSDFPSSILYYIAGCCSVVS